MVDIKQVENKLDCEITDFVINLITYAGDLVNYNVSFTLVKNNQVVNTDISVGKDNKIKVIELSESNNLDKEIESDDKLTFNHYWNKSKMIWKQPPVKIKHGDLVEIEYGHSVVLGRYIGKGYGVAEISKNGETTRSIGRVVSRGVDNNPKLVSDQVLLEYIKE